MTVARHADDVPTLVAIGAGVAVAASLAHEALGHGLGCVADGGTVTLLTFLLFRCAGAGVLADGGGPVGAFLVAAACLAAVHALRPRPAAPSLFLFALGIQTMFWVCAQMVREGIDGADDWGHVARDLAWPHWWHGVVVAIGAAGYAAAIRIAAISGRRLAEGRPERLLIPYAATAASAVFFGALWHGGRTASALDGLLSFGVAPLGYLLAIGAIARDDAPPRSGAIRPDRVWQLGAVLACLAFALTIARGVGRLA